MKRITIAMLLALLFVSCAEKSKNHFLVQGKIKPQTDSLIYLLEIGTDGVQVVDSTQVDQDGLFSFSRQGYAYPMLYSLRLGNRYIHFAADSTTQLSLEASVHTFGKDYVFTEADSTNRDIREISLRKLSVDASIDSLYRLYRNATITGERYMSDLSAIVSNFKEWLTRRFIYKNPRSAASYFALCQQKDGLLYFNVADPVDSRAFSAVATAYDTYYPQAPYTPSLHKMALQSVVFARQNAALTRLKQQTADSTRVTNFPDLSLMDDKGQMQKLSEVASRHTAVLICFSTYAAESSPARVRQLRDLYNKHAAQGYFEIYDIAIDDDLYFWRNAVRTLPWICVNDALRSSLATYNVTALPTYFLLKNGVLKRLTAPAAE